MEAPIRIYRTVTYVHDVENDTLFDDHSDLVETEKTAAKYRSRIPWRRVEDTFRAVPNGEKVRGTKHC